MSTATETVTAPDVDHDGLDVYCPESQSWARTRDLFCEDCGDPGHDLR